MAPRKVMEETTTSLSIRKTHSRFKPYPMTDVDPHQKGGKDFGNCGRTGRRNALADILDSNVVSTTTASLPLDLQKLKCTDDEDESQKSSSACSAKEPDVVPASKDSGSSTSS